MQFLKVEFEMSTMYPVAQDEQFFASDTHPLQLASHDEHLFVVISAYVPNGQLVEDTHVFVLVFRKVVVGQDVQLVGSD